MSLWGNIATKVSFKWSFERTENPFMVDFNVQIISAFVEAVSVLRDHSIVCCRLEVGAWLLDSISIVSAPSTVVCLTERGFLKRLRTFFKASLCFWALPWSTTADRPAEDNSKVLRHILHLARFVDLSSSSNQSLKSGSFNQSSTKYFWFLILLLLLILIL